MISEPLKYIEDFADAGADIISFHIESESNPEETIDKIISCGCKAALAVKPGTNIDTVYPFMDKLSMVLVMTVEPGFGGQSFMADMMPKIEKLRNRYPDVDIQVDGGINAETVKVCARAGANVFVAGSAVFKSENPAETISLKKECKRYMKKERESVFIKMSNEIKHGLKKFRAGKLILRINMLMTEFIPINSII